MEEEDKLINLVCKYPTLYDTSVENYKNNLIKDNIWKDIGRELKKNSKYILLFLYLYIIYVYRVSQR